MSESSLHTEHPVDELPDYARGVASDAARIERHLAGCDDCRAELGLLRALGASGPPPLSDMERERVRRAVQERRGAARRRTGPHPWLALTWRVAAAIALLLTSVGVWRVVQEGSATDWDPGLALDGWGEEVAELGLEAGDVRLALGVGILDDAGLEPSWDGSDLEELMLPWDQEEDR